ncbi:FAD-dependent oxidoreductase [Gulosibacter sp. 10]|uniref:FAD-dependent oxidoreductase n=1 Tax=Gulosibacter sp. 10 TaxID=1255570 RepID=UPI00097EEDF7|nr:FAD-dependent oxidoreductase [Gulosibacter sp. 10]SJM63832.1 3-oxosteroid 1-dehydrogenase [Gulosibacter sp. 10]
MPQNPQSASSFDVVVAGSGAAGLVTAIRTASAGLRTLVIESGERFGGTTALSGGRVWIPANGTPANSGDSPELAKSYLRRLFDRRWPEFVDAFVDTAPRLREFVEARSPHRFVVCPNYPDYHQHLEGASTGGRCFDMAVLDTRVLVEEARQVRYPPSYSPITHAEWEEWRFPERIDAPLLAKRFEEGGRTGGHALAAALVDGAVRAGAELRPRASLRGVEEAGGARRLVLDTPEGSETLDAGAVVLATGGYDADPGLRAELLPAGLSVSASAPTNTGAALEISRSLGADIANESDGWWMPMALVPGEELDGRPYPRGLVRERGVPRSIIVNARGERFIDEASPYNEFGKKMHERDEAGECPNSVAWLVFDEGFRARYPFPGLPATGELPEHIRTAESIGALARELGIEPAALESTVARWNRLSEQGADEDLHRGENAYDRYYGDPWAGPAVNLGPIDRAPYYATRIYSGSIGSKGGPVTDTHGRILRGGRPLDGVYAVGNASAFWTGDGYPGPGATLAVGMVMGLRAGDAIAAASTRSAADGR